MRARDLRPLWATTTALLATLLVLVVAHDVDHVVNEERLGDLTAAFWIFLPFQYGAYAVTLALAWRAHRHAPALVALLAATSLLAFPAAHLVPFGPLPYEDGDPLAVSWALIFVPMAVALATFVAALRLRAATAS